jgi:hypothetical protein
MGYILFPLLALAFFTGIFAIANTQTKIATPPTIVSQANNDGVVFASYRDSVAVYLQNNPTFIGSVPSASLAAEGYQFPTNFLSVSGNYVTQVGGGNGRIITSYSKLTPGAVTAALAATSNDASFGIASGGNWTSYAQGVNQTPQTLATAVPDGDVVSVIQIGI